MFTYRINEKTLLEILDLLGDVELTVACGGGYLIRIDLEQIAQIDEARISLNYN